MRVSLSQWGQHPVDADPEAYLRELMKFDAKKMGKIEDIRKTEGNLPKGMRGEPWVDLGISRTTFYKRLQLGRRRSSNNDPNSIESRKPWIGLGISRDTYYVRKGRGW